MLGEQRPTFYPDSVLVMHRPLEYTSRKMVLSTAIYSYAFVCLSLFLPSSSELTSTSASDSQQAVVGQGDAVMKAYDYDKQASTGSSFQLPSLLSHADLVSSPLLHTRRSPFPVTEFPQEVLDELAKAGAKKVEGGKPATAKL
jgi:hypothetical protein